MRKPEPVEIVAISIDHVVEAIAVMMLISMIAVWAVILGGGA